MIWHSFSFFARASFPSENRSKFSTTSDRFSGNREQEKCGSGPAAGFLLDWTGIVVADALKRGLIKSWISERQVAAGRLTHADVYNTRQWLITMPSIRCFFTSFLFSLSLFFSFFSFHFGLAGSLAFHWPLIKSICRRRVLTLSPAHLFVLDQCEITIYSADKGGIPSDRTVISLLFARHG